MERARLAINLRWDIPLYFIKFVLYILCKCSQISPNCNYCILSDECCVLTVHNILYILANTQRDGLSQNVNVLITHE